MVTREPMFLKNAFSFENELIILKNQRVQYLCIFKVKQASTRREFGNIKFNSILAMDIKTS